MRYELTHLEWAAIRQLLPNKPRGVPRVDDRRILNGIFRLLHLGAPWRDLPESFDRIMTGHLTITEMEARQRLQGQAGLCDAVRSPKVSGRYASGSGSAFGCGAFAV